MKNTSTRSRPLPVKVYVPLLLLGAVVMAALGWSASAYYVPALCLLLQASLLWAARAFRLFKWIAFINLASGTLLILVLWLGDGLPVKLDISASMLLVNLLCGGPLMAVLASLMLPSLRHGGQLFTWFNSRSVAQGAGR